MAVWRSFDIRDRCGRRFFVVVLIMIDVSHGRRAISLRKAPVRFGDRADRPEDAHSDPPYNTQLARWQHPGRSGTVPRPVF